MYLAQLSCILQIIKSMMVASRPSDEVDIFQGIRRLLYPSLKPHICFIVTFGLVIWHSFPNITHNKVNIKAILKNICLFPIFDRMGKNSGKRYGMIFCVINEKHFPRTCPNQHMNKVFYCSQIQRFYCGQNFDHTSVSRILDPAWGLFYVHSRSEIAHLHMRIVKIERVSGSECLYCHVIQT